MERPDEKQHATATSLETRLPASSSFVTAERMAPMHPLRNEIRVWTRDLLIAIGLALVIIVFLPPAGKSQRHQHGPPALRPGTHFHQKICLPLRADSAWRRRRLLVSARSLKIIHQAGDRVAG